MHGKRLFRLDIFFANRLSYRLSCRISLPVITYPFHTIDDSTVSPHSFIIPVSTRVVCRDGFLLILHDFSQDFLIDPCTDIFLDRLHFSLDGMHVVYPVVFSSRQIFFLPDFFPDTFLVDTLIGLLFDNPFDNRYVCRLFNPHVCQVGKMNSLTMSESTDFPTFTV